MRPAVLVLEESTQPGTHTQLAWSSLMVYIVVSIGGKRLGKGDEGRTLCSSADTIALRLEIHDFGFSRRVA